MDGFFFGWEFGFARKEGWWRPLASRLAAASKAKEILGWWTCS